MMMRPESDGSRTLLATTLTGQELFAVQERQGRFTVLQQLPETRRIPLPYVFRDVAWASASAAAFAAMAQPECSSLTTNRVRGEGGASGKAFPLENAYLVRLAS